MKNNVIAKTAEELKLLPCRRGHDRHDAYVNINPFTGKVILSCKTCRKNDYAEKQLELAETKEKLFKKGA